jgi:hypothetical protein
MRWRENPGSVEGGREDSPDCSAVGPPIALQSAVVGS